MILFDPLKTITLLLYFAMYSAHLGFVRITHGVIMPIIIPTACNHYTHE